MKTDEKLDDIVKLPKQQVDISDKPPKSGPKTVDFKENESECKSLTRVIENPSKSQEDPVKSPTLENPPIDTDK